MSEHLYYRRKVERNKEIEGDRHAISQDPCVYVIEKKWHTFISTFKNMYFIKVSRHRGFVFIISYINKNN